MPSIEYSLLFQFLIRLECQLKQWREAAFILVRHQRAVDAPVGSRSDVKQGWIHLEEVEAVLCSLLYNFLRYRQGLPRLVGTF